MVFDRERIRSDVARHIEGFGMVEGFNFARRHLVNGVPKLAGLVSTRILLKGMKHAQAIFNDRPEFVLRVVEHDSLLRPGCKRRSPIPPAANTDDTIADDGESGPCLALQRRFWSHRIGAEGGLSMTDQEITEL